MAGVTESGHRLRQFDASFLAGMCFPFNSYMTGLTAQCDSGMNTFCTLLHFYMACQTLAVISGKRPVCENRKKDESR
jgi:hypothetical protein